MSVLWTKIAKQPEIAREVQVVNVPAVGKKIDEGHDYAVKLFLKQAGVCADKVDSYLHAFSKVQAGQWEISALKGEIADVIKAFAELQVACTRAAEMASQAGIYNVMIDVLEELESRRT